MLVYQNVARRAADTPIKPPSRVPGSCNGMTRGNLVWGEGDGDGLERFGSGRGSGAGVIPVKDGGEAVQGVEVPQPRCIQGMDHGRRTYFCYM